jgi:Zn-dependent protease with chaperone function
MNGIAYPAAGSATYFDGRISTRRAVQVLLTAATLQFEDADGRLLGDWPYAEIEALNAPRSVLRLGRRKNARLERLEIRDEALAAAIDARASRIDRSGGIERRQQVAVIGWSLLATMSLVLIAWVGVPAAAARLTPYVPAALERKLGDAIDVKVRAGLEGRQAGAALECGLGADKARARAALGAMRQKLEHAAALDVPLTLTVVHRPESNAFALPGGHVYVFEGLIDKSATADELAGVLAHEIGHVAHRDGTRAVLQQAGLSFLFGMLLGDFGGGGAVVITARTVLQSSYSREQETAADAYGVALMQKAGGNPRALGAILDKIGGATEPGMKILRDHPETAARIAALNRLAPADSAHPALLPAADWAALRAICKG